jgi:hypothetical protein
MSQVKELKVSLTPVDEKAFNPGARTRKRRVSSKAAEAAAMKGGDTWSTHTDGTGADLAQGVPIPSLVVQGGPVVPSLSNSGASWIPTGDSVSSAMPNMAALTTPHVGVTAADIPLNVGPPPAGGGVRLGAKKSFHSTSSHTKHVAPKNHGVVVGAKKRAGALNAVGGAALPLTRKKPKLIISTHPAKSASTHAGTLDKTRRKFRERSISIVMRPSGKGAAKKIREKVAGLPMASVRRTLIRKGVLKPNGKTPPDAMMRSMLRDYMLLHTAD